MRRFFLSALFSLLASHAISQTTQPKPANSNFALDLQYSFDGARLTKRLMRGLAADAGVQYVGHTVCIGYENCGVPFVRKGRRDLGNLTANQPFVTSKAQSTVVNLTVSDDVLGTVIYDVIDKPCALPKTALLNNAVTTRACFGNYHALLRTRHELGGSVAPTGWDTMHSVTVETFRKGRWRVAQTTVQREWVRGRFSTSGGYYTGTSINVTDGNGNELKNEELESYTIATSIGGATTTQKCDALAALVGSLPNLLGAGTEALCKVGDIFTPDMASLGIPGAISISSSDTNLCPQFSSVSDAIGTTLTEAIRLACYIDPNSFFPSASSGGGSGSISIDELVEESEFANPDDEIVTEPMGRGECRSISEIVTLDVAGQTCTVQVTTNCSETASGDCECETPVLADPICK